MTITMYWMNENNEREIVEILYYLNKAHTECMIQRKNGNCIAIPTEDLIVVTDICDEK